MTITDHPVLTDRNTMTTTESTAPDQHRHAFYLLGSFIGRESRQKFHVSTCSCGKSRTVTTDGRQH